jgi:predicted transcriptional regulator
VTPPAYAPVTPEQAAAETRAHGTYARYHSGPAEDGQPGPCRCLRCSAASARRQQDRYRLIAYGQWDPFTDAGPARAHVLALSTYGVGWKRIASVAGVSQGAVQRLLWGRRGEPPTRRMRHATAARLLAVRPSPALLGPGTLTAAAGTRRRLQALIAVGHCRIVLAARLGVASTNLNRIIRSAERVHTSTARAVCALYDELWDTPPDESTIEATRRAARARREGLAHGWPPPAAWDDHQIDDAAAVPPAGWQRRDGKLRDSAALAEDAAELIEKQGYDRLTAAMRLGVSRHALDKAFDRTRARDAGPAAHGHLTPEGHSHAA